MTPARRRRTSTEAMQRCYTRAERMLPWHVGTMVLGMPSEPKWLDGGQTFWYWTQAPSQRQFFKVATATGSREPLFDHRRLARALTGNGVDASVARALHLERVRFLHDEPGAMRFDLDGSTWTCDLETYACSGGRAPERPAGVPSPDGSLVAFVRGGNVWIHDLRRGDERPLTTDGSRVYGYGANEGFGQPQPPVLTWSPDGKRLVALRIDRRGLRQFHLIRSVRGDGGARPLLYTYPYVLPGDERVPRIEICCLDPIEGGGPGAVAGPFPSVLPFEPWWGSEGTRIYFMRYGRGFDRAELWAMDPNSGAARRLMTEEAENRVDLNAFDSVSPMVHVLERSGSILWFSRQDGWGHLYLHDLASGALQHRITRGEWVVRDVAWVDEAEHWIYFVASGREPGRDPYYRHLYRVRFDGSALELLTPEDADHAIFPAPDGQHFVDRHARVDSEPVAVLRRPDGSMVAEIGRADLGRLRRGGWLPPEPFRAKAQDGETDVFGVLFRPSGFDPSRSYPVIDHVYPGPHCIHTPKAFTLPGWQQGVGDAPPGARVLWDAQAMAELGFIVVIVDGLGTAGRSRAFHDVSYRNQANAGGLGDHVAALRQLAATRSYLDLDRVGIYGVSAGGYAAARGMLAYPDFFKVGVSVAGNHDPRRGKASYIERYFGRLTDETEPVFLAQRNLNLVAALKGKLMLAHGDADDNVHPAQTLELLHGFIRANKDVDLMILPTRRHDLPNDSYFVRRLWDYFVTHLQGNCPPEGYRIEGPRRPALP